MPLLLLCSLLLIHMSVSDAFALPSYAPHIVRHTNVTLTPPTSFSGEENSWQRNVYILQVTRIALLIFLAISIHIIYARWLISKHHRCTRTVNPQMAMGTQMEVDLESMDLTAGVINDSEPGISAPAIRTDVAVELAPAISVQHGDLPAPPRAHQNRPSSERASDNADALNASYCSNQATDTTATNN